jgi:hypothetical protein
MTSFLDANINRFQRYTLFIGIAGLLLTAVGVFTHPRQFFISYLFGYLFWLGLTLGCFAITMLHHLTGGRWGYPTRRFLEAGFSVLPVMSVLFIPVLLGISDLYPWAAHAAAKHDEILQKQAAYMNRWAFVGRAIFFFVLWNVMVICLRKWSLEQDRSPDPEPMRKLRYLSGLGMVIFPLTATFAYVDWILSTEPHWYSTMFAVIVLIGQILTAFSFCVILLSIFGKQQPLAAVLNRTHYHHLGNLLLTFVLFWTYVSFGQLLIIYAGNLPREINWYLHRITGGWVYLVGTLGLLHFFLPFVLLLFRTVKQHVSRLTAIATVLFLAHILNVYWMIAPSFYPSGVSVHWTDFTAFGGIGGIWITVFLSRLKSAPLLPQHDPGQQFAFSYAHAH